MDLYIERSGSSTPRISPENTPRTGRVLKRTGQDSFPNEASSSKRCPIPSFSSCVRPFRDQEISTLINYGSEEESEDEEDEDSIGPHGIVLPRASRMFLIDDENIVDEGQANARLDVQWPVRAPPVSNYAAELVPKEEPVEAESSAYEPVSKFDFKWRAFPYPQIPPELRREPFSDIECGPTALYASPYDSFTAIWDHRIMEHIAMETNRYARQLIASMLETGNMFPNSRITKWRDTDVDELYVYFAIILATGIVIKSRLEEYWNSTKDIFSTPGFTVSMRYDRFQLLSKCLHFQNNDGYEPKMMTRPQAKLFKVQTILDHLNDKFSKLYNMSQNVALDESLTMWKGWLDINQFTHNKAATVGIKSYEVCESQTGYLWRFEVHAGHDTTSDPQEDSPVSGIVPALVLRLLNGLEDKGHTIWMDNFYNSPALARELKVRGFDCVGTLRTNRQFVPFELTNLTKADMAVGQVSGCTSGDVDLVIWRHKNRVAFVSTYHGLATVMCGDSFKPNIVADYNICMGGVDRKDQMIAMFPIERRRTKIWYKKFFRRLLNASVLNAFILLKTQHPIAHRRFRKTLVSELLTRHSKTSHPLHTAPITGHFPGQYDFIEKDGRKRDRARHICVNCKKRSTTYCKACNVPLCIFTCFEPYHTPTLCSDTSQ